MKNNVLLHGSKIVRSQLRYCPIELEFDKRSNKLCAFNGSDLRRQRPRTAWATLPGEAARQEARVSGETVRQIFNDFQPSTPSPSFNVFHRGPRDVQKSI
ncbi:hypothetical protein [Bradyrhizobium diazoefficiens]|uniref:hypothetical protein n=1 Tax=Bradyrhizobium diazoefficiens TaxID=1355477 RepID=UPI00351876E6